MTTIVLPAHVGAFAQMESTPERAQTLATNLRAVTTSVKDVQADVEDRGAPDGWEGETADAASHATTAFARRLAGAEAALFRAVTATDTFEDRLRTLSSDRGRLETRRSTLNGDIEDLEGEIRRAPADVDPVIVSDFERRAAALRSRADSLQTDIDAWVTSYDEAETAYIQALGRVDTVDEGRTAATDPTLPDIDALTAQMQARSNDPVAMAAWWKGLSPAQRQALITEHPQLVGNANGVPVADRDEANRGAVYSDIDYLEQREADGQLTDAERSALANARHVRDTIRDYSNQVDELTGEELLHVIVYRPYAHTGDGGVAISLGNPDTADHVSASIPGITSETGSLAGNMQDIEALRNAALDREDGTVATIFWLDYDAPSNDSFDDPAELLDMGNVLTPYAAAQGGERFADFISGLRASDEGEQAHLTAIGHSYGSTTLGWGLQAGADVDDAIVIGSPGQPMPRAELLTDADVWVGSKDYDPVTLLGHEGLNPSITGVLGWDPANVSFGGTRFETGDGSFRIEDLIENHTSYYEGASLSNMADIMTGNDGDVETAAERGTPGGIHPGLADLVAGSAVASGIEQGIAGAQWTGERIVEGAQWTGERVVEGAQWTGERVVEGAQWTGERVVEGAELVVDGAEWVGDRVVEGAQATGEAVVDGVEAAVDTAEEGGKWLWDHTVGLF